MSHLHIVPAMMPVESRTIRTGGSSICQALAKKL